MSHLLYIGQADKALTLEQAIARAGMGSGVALLASPWSYTVARIDGLRLLVPADDTLRTEKDADLADVFEARLFDESVELRWLQNPESEDRAGTAVLLGEDADRAARLGAATSTLAYHHARENRYVLWGSNLDPADGTPPDSSAAGGGTTTADQATTRWVGLSAARIGVLAVPAPRTPDEHERVYLECLEYIGVIDGHGNAAVVEERLLRLSVRRLRTGDESIETRGVAIVGDKEKMA